MIARLLALVGRRQATPSAALPLDDLTPATTPGDAAAWAALLGPDQPIPPLEVVPSPAQPDRVATMRLVSRLRQACGLEGER